MLPAENADVFEPEQVDVFRLICNIAAKVGSYQLNTNHTIKIANGSKLTYRRIRGMNRPAFCPIAP